MEGIYERTGGGMRKRRNATNRVLSTYSTLWGVIHTGCASSLAREARNIKMAKAW